MALTEACGFKNAERAIMPKIQFERTGPKDPFESYDSGWISMVKK
jgi:hypothetical protein